MFNKEFLKSILLFLLIGFFVVFFYTLSLFGVKYALSLAIQFVFLFSGFFIIIWLLYKISIHIVSIKKLDKIDFLKTKDLYRDILYQYSPVSLSYIDQMFYDENIAIVSGLLSLENKKYITIQNNEISRLKYDSYNLDKPEKYIYENIRNNKVSINKDALLESIITDCQDKDLIKKSQNGQKKRTEEAKELNQKLEGLKSYLNNYSTLDTKEAQNLSLWEDYLIYSVIFRQNKKILNEYKKYYEIN